MKNALLVNHFVPILAQSGGGLAQGASKAMGIVMLIGFIFGTVCVIGGAFPIRRGDTDAGKLSIIARLVTSPAPGGAKSPLPPLPPRPPPPTTASPQPPPPPPH